MNNILLLLWSKPLLWQMFFIILISELAELAFFEEVAELPEQTF